MTDRPRRHCMVVDNVYPDIRVERETRALLERGYHVDVICLRGPGQPRRQRMGRLTVYCLPLARRRGSSVVAQLGEYLAFAAWAAAMVTLRHLRMPYTSVQAHNVPDFLVFSALVPKLLGSRVILDLHDLMPEFFASRFGNGMNSLLVRAVVWQERLATAFADHVITVTDLWRSDLLGRGVAARKVSVVMNLPDNAVFGAHTAVERAPNQPMTLIYHGTITRRYGLDILLRAFARARERCSLRLLIHGRGEYFDAMRALVDELGIGEEVEISTGLLPTAELPALIRRGDIGVVPNRNDVFTDGILPTKLMEYAVLGIPSIVSRSRAVEAYFDDQMVRFVEPGDVEALADAICEVAADADLRRSLADGARRFAERHRWQDEANRYADLVDSLNAGRR